MGVELVEGRDLFCRDNVVYMRTTSRRAAGGRDLPADRRRVPRPAAVQPRLGARRPGLLNAARAGNVALANAVGNGVADDKLVYTYVPDMIRYYLGEKPLLPNVDTFRCWLPDEQDHVLDQLDELVVKPVEGSGGYGILFGPNASARQLASARRAIRDDPRGVDRPAGGAALHGADQGGRQARAPARRPAAVRGQRRRRRDVLPGGLTRVALPRAAWWSTPARAAAARTPGCSRARALGRRPRAGPARLATTSRPARRRRAGPGADAPAAATAATAAAASARGRARC